MLINNSLIFNFYQYFYSKKYGNSNYILSPSEKAIDKTNKFIILLDKKYNLHMIGGDFLTKYFLFQFSRVDGQIFVRFATKKDGQIASEGKVQIYDVIGKAAFKYWLDRNIEFDYTLTQSPIITKYSLSLQAIKELYSIKPSLENIFEAEEIEKKRFYNTQRGFVNCIEKTSLFHHRSLNCAFCENKENCKKLLKVNYSKIYKNRGYESKDK